MQLFKSKKAINDVTLIWTIFVILFSLGIFVPLIEDYFTGISTDYNVDEVTAGVSQDLPEVSANPLTIIDFGRSILLMFFWSFNVHWVINLILLEPMRIIFYILIYRLIRSGGG